MAEIAWDDCKVAFRCDESDVFNVIYESNPRLPRGWSLIEWDGSGARGVIVFRVENALPTERACGKVRALIDRLQTKGSPDV